MTNEEARAWLEHHFDPLPDGTKQSEAVSLAIKALEQKPCEDWHDVSSDEMTLEQARQAVKDLRKKLAEYLEQEPKTGHREYNDIFDHYLCGNCKTIVMDYDNYCPNCGCRMVEPQERSE